MYAVTEARVPSAFLWVLRFKGPIKSEMKKKGDIIPIATIFAMQIIIVLGKIIKEKERLFCSNVFSAILLGKIRQPMCFRFNFAVDPSSLPNGL